MKKQVTITTTEPEKLHGYFGSFWTIEARINDRPVLDTYCDSKQEAESLKTYLEAMPEVAKLMEVYNEFKKAEWLTEEKRDYSEMLTAQLEKLNEIL